MKYSKYPTYRDSGVEWLGKIPSQWRINKVGYSFQAKKGNKAALYTKEFCGTIEGKYPVYSGQTENNGILSKINEFEFDAKEEGYLFSTTVGAKAMSLSHLKGKFSLSQNCMVIIPINKDIVTRFHYYHLQPKFSYERGLIPEHMQASFRMEDLYSYKFAIPPYEEQQAIANYLDKATAKIDTLIEKQTKLIELLREKRQAVISTAVTRGLDNTVAMKDSGVEWLGEIPEEWEAKKLKFISTVNDDTLSDNTSGELEINYIDIGSVTTGHIQCYEKMSYADAPSRARRIIKDGDILVSTVRTYLKAIAPVSILYDNYVASTGFAVIRSGIELDSSFAKYALLSNYFIDLVESRSVGVSYPAINASDLVTFSIALPSIQEQQTISNYLDDKTTKVDKLITKATKAIDLLKEKRTALISAAVTGKIDVREIA